MGWFEAHTGDPRGRKGGARKQFRALGIWATRPRESKSRIRCMPHPVVIVSRALTTAEVDAEIDDILQRPYSYVFSPDPEVDGFAASILEFPGCFAQGETFDGAYTNIRSAAREWLRAVFRQGQAVPCPVDPSARLVPLQLPHDLHAAVRREAARQGSSLEDFVAQLLTDQFGSDTVLVAAIEAAVAPPLGRLQASFVARFPQLEASRGVVKGSKVKAFVYLTTTWPDLEEPLVVGAHVLEAESGDFQVTADVCGEFSGFLHLNETPLLVPRSLGPEMVAAAAGKLAKDICERAWATLYQGDVVGPRVHVVHRGFALCGKPGLPGRWTGGHRHVPVEQVEHATCEICRSRAPDVAP